MFLRLLACLMLVVPMAATAQNQPSSQFEKFSARVQVLVSADGQLGDDIKSYLNRGLRNLGDVIVTDDKPEYRISIVAIENQSHSGAKLGLGVSILITEPINADLLSWTIAVVVGPKDAKASETLQKSIEGQVKGYERVLYHAIRISGPDAVRGLCESLVTSFDADILEGARKIHQEVYEKYIKKKS